MRLRNTLLVASAACAAISSAVSAATLVPLSSFGGGDGWRAPNEVVAGDTAGTTTGGDGVGYAYLELGNNERGLTYNPVTGNLILVSRSTAGNGIRLLNGTTGVDVGALSQTGIAGGNFIINKAGVGSDGQIYVGNLQANVGTGAFKVYQYANEAATPTTFFNSTIAGFGGTPRFGDTLDVTGAGAGTTIVAGGSGTTGYAVINGSGATAVASFSGTGAPATGDFRIGVTFAGSANDVWGKQTAGSAAGAPVRRTTYSGSTGTAVGTSILTIGGEGPIDYAVVNGTPYLASLDVNNSLVRIYDVTNPGSPVLVTSATTTSGTLTSNINGAGDVVWGPITGSTATIYAMSTNQGIQALTFDAAAFVPEPATLSMLAGAAVVGLRRRR